MIMATVSRSGGGWQMAAIGETGQGRTYKDMTAMIRDVA
jgi:stress response protein SCP2